MRLSMMLIIVIAFGLAISLAYKIEINFQYYKKIKPEKYKNLNSVIDAMNKFHFINPLLFLPVFANRQKKMESENSELRNYSI